MTKKEHFIPRAAYLRGFSNTHWEDDRKNKLNFYNKGSNQFGNSNVYELGFENLLYENKDLDDNAVEEFLSEIDGDLVNVFKPIISVCSLPQNNNALVLNGKTEKDNLKFFVTLQYYRTPKKRESYNGSKEERQRAFLTGIIGRADNGEWLITRNMNDLADHFFVFERNETETPFVISDQPITIFNTYSDGKDVYNFRFPISPFIHAILIDPKSSEDNTWRDYRNRLRVIEQGNDHIIDFWNNLALEDSRRFIYYTPGYDFQMTSDGLKLETLKS